MCVRLAPRTVLRTGRVWAFSQIRPTAVLAGTYAQLGRRALVASVSAVWGRTRLSVTLDLPAVCWTMGRLGACRWPCPAYIVVSVPMFAVCRRRSVLTVLVLAGLSQQVRATVRRVQARICVARGNVFPRTVPSAFADPNRTPADPRDSVVPIRAWTSLSTSRTAGPVASFVRAICSALVVSASVQTAKRQAPL